MEEVVSDDDNMAILQQQQEHQRFQSGRETGDRIGCRRPHPVRSLETCGQRPGVWLLGKWLFVVGTACRCFMELGLQSERADPADNG